LGSQSLPIAANQHCSDIKIKILLDSKLCWQKDNNGGNDASGNDNNDSWGKLFWLLVFIVVLKATHFV